MYILAVMYYKVHNTYETLCLVLMMVNFVFYHVCKQLFCVMKPQVNSTQFHSFVAFREDEKKHHGTVGESSSE